MNSDRNLLFGVLALQADFLDAAQFAEACSAWTARKDTPLADLLVQRGWLRAEFALRLKQPDRAASRASIRFWQQDPDLAGVRDEAELAKLPEKERQAWRTLWADVAAFLKKGEPR